MVSILQTEKKCWVCGCKNNLHLHHTLYGGDKRRLSDKYGLTIWLCSKHHNMSDEGVHYNKELDLRVKQMAQMECMQHYNMSMEEWLKIFRRNYL